MADAETESLSASLALNRARLAGSTAALAEQLNVSRRVRHGVTHHPALWIGAALLIGVLITARPRQPRRVEVRAKRSIDEKDAGKVALLVGLTKLTLDVLRPTLTTWLRRRVSPRA